jgi:hypothetical protein
MELSRWMAGQQDRPPLGTEPAWREQVLLRGEAYRRWICEGLGRTALNPAGSRHGRLG